jgi:N-acetylmuramoyl-L-alanine amidase
MSTQTTVVCAAVFGLVLSCCNGPAQTEEASGPSDVGALMKQLGYRRTSRRGNPTVTYEAPGRSVVLQSGSRRACVDGIAVWMNAPMTGQRASWTVPHADAWWTLTPILRPSSVLRAASLAPVVLDAGHGGSDTGAIGPRGVREKDITLDLARRLGKRLQEMKIETVLTRGDDLALSLTERTDSARRAGGALFVSLHLNASGNPKSRGVETYMLTAPGFPSTADGSKPEPPCVGNAFDAPSGVLAFSVHQALLAGMQTEDRGVRHARFAVLKTAPCPAILVEAGFLSNPSEAALLASPEYRTRLVDALADGICRYLRLVAAAQRP